MEYFTDTDIMLLNFERHYKEKIKAKGLDLLMLGKLLN